MSYRWCEIELSIEPTSRCPGSYVFVNNQVATDSGVIKAEMLGSLIRLGSMRVAGVYMPQIRITNDCYVPGRRYNGYVYICFHFTVRYDKRSGSAKRNIYLDVYTCDRYNTRMLRERYLRWLRRRRIGLNRLRQMSYARQRTLLMRFYREFLIETVKRLMRRMDTYLTRCYNSIHCHLYDQSYLGVWHTLQRQPLYYIIGVRSRVRVINNVPQIVKDRDIRTPFYACQ